MCIIPDNLVTGVTRSVCFLWEGVRLVTDYFGGRDRHSFLTPVEIEHGFFHLSFSTEGNFNIYSLSANQVNGHPVPYTVSQEEVLR